METDKELLDSAERQLEWEREKTRNKWEQKKHCREQWTARFSNPWLIAVISGIIVLSMSLTYSFFKIDTRDRDLVIELQKRKFQFEAERRFTDECKLQLKAFREALKR